MLVADPRVDHLAHVPLEGDLLRRLQTLPRGLVARVRRLRAAVHACGLDAPALLILQRPDAAADGAVLQLNCKNRIYLFHLAYLL